MDAKVHPVIAILVIVGVILSVGVWTWGNGASKAIGGPSELVIDPDGHLFIQIQNQLLEHDQNGTFIARHNLAELGVDDVIGGLAFFSNGDILLRRGGDDRSFLDNFRAYLRWENQRSITPDEPGAGVVRCNLRAKSCMQFGSDAIDFKAAYSVLIDDDSNAVYVADTTRHLLRKYSTNGQELATPIGGVKFPNHLILNDSLLLIADTNYHRIKIIDPASDPFGTEVSQKDVVPAAANRAGQTWPSHFEHVGENWWVNNMTAAMNNGGIYIFDKEWEYVRKADLPNGADPITIVAFNQQVLVSDWNNDVVHTLSIDGTYSGRFSSIGLTQLVQESIERRMEYKFYAWVGIGIFAGIIILLLLMVIRTTSSRNSSIPDD